MLHLCILLLALVAGAAADGGIAYRGPPPVKEVFHLNAHLSYYLYSDHVSFSEANSICKSNGGQLATVDTSVKAAFLAQSIGDAWAALEDMWVGGQLILNTWTWIGNSKKLPDIPHQTPNATFLYPPWVDGATPVRKGRDCLAIDRNGHSDPFFVDLDCKLPRPFVCETAKKDVPEGPVITKTITIFDYEFILYHGRLSWDGAVAFCRSQGFVLATILNNTYATKLAKAMLKTRPEFEDVWIGGSYKNDKWTWVENSDEIPVESAPNGPNGELFPPWAHVPPNGGSPDAPNCILFDRHLCESPKFFDIKCNRLRDFVCAKQVSIIEGPAVVEEIITVRKKTYHIHHEPATFEDARVICEDPKSPSGPGKMLYIDGGQVNDPYDELSVIMQLMSDTKDELQHVWLAATYSEENGVGAFKWIYETPNLLNGSANNNGLILSRTVDEATGYPPWCNNEEPGDTTMACLNLDRQNYNTPLFYGLECNVTQSVICVTEAIPKGVERFSTPKASYQSSDHNLTDNKVTWNHANKLCQEDTGALLTAVDDAELKIVAERMPDGDYFIGGRISSSANNTPVWIPSREPIQLGIPVKSSQPGKNCLTMRIQNKAVASIDAIACDEHLPYNFICQDHCGDFVNEVKDHSWHCNWNEGSAVTEAVLGKVCEKRCPVYDVLAGSRKITCQPNGWVGSRLGQPAQCLSIDAAATKLSDLLFAASADPRSVIAGKISNESKLLSHNGVVIIYDGSSSVTVDELQVVKYIIGSTIGKLEPKSGSRQRRNARGRRGLKSHRRSRSKRQAPGADAPGDADNKLALKSNKAQPPNSILVPLINLNQDNQEPVVLDSLQPCDVIIALDKVPFVKGRGGRDYGGAFVQAKKFLDANPDEQYAVVVLSAGPNQGDDYREILRGLRQAAKSVITVGIGSRFNSEELADIATTDGQRNLQHIAVSEYGAVKELSDSLAKIGKCANNLASLKAAADNSLVKIQDVKLTGAPAELEDLSENEGPPNKPSVSGGYQSAPQQVNDAPGSSGDSGAQSEAAAEAPAEGDVAPVEAPAEGETPNEGEAAV